MSPKRDILNPVLTFKLITKEIVTLKSHKLFITITINNTLHLRVCISLGLGASNYSIFAKQLIDNFVL